MANFSIGYTSQASVIYEVTFRQFTNQSVMRTYQPTVAFKRSVSGTTVLAGPADVSKYVWGVSGMTDKAIGIQIDEMYRAWSADRATGIAAAVAILDETWGNIGTRSAVFSTPPTFEYLNDKNVIAAFGLTEV